MVTTRKSYNSTCYWKLDKKSTMINKVTENNHQKKASCSLPSAHFLTHNYHQVSNIRRTKSQNLMVSHLVLQSSLANPKKTDVKLRMKMYLEQHRQAMLQLHPSDQQFYGLLRCVLYERLDGMSVLHNENKTVKFILKAKISLPYLINEHNYIFNHFLLTLAFTMKYYYQELFSVLNGWQLIMSIA